MTKLLHTGDFHLNAVRYFRDQYLERMEFTLGKINKIAYHEHVDFIVVAGDFFERRDILHEERLLLTRWISGMNIPIVGISGNHDKRSEEMGDTVLSYLSGLDFEQTHVFHDGPPLVVPFDTCTFVLFPFNGWTDHEFFLLMDSAMSEVRLLKGDNPVVVVMHEAVLGGVFDNGMVVESKNPIHLDEDFLEKFPEVTYWALGDMHSYQSVAPNVWYAGAPQQTKFGEKEGKGVLIVDTDNPTKPKFVEVASMPLVDACEAPTDYQFDNKALYTFSPDHAVPASLRLPSNVRVRSKLLQREESVSQGLGGMVHIFDGLDSALLRAGLKRDLIPQAIDLAHKVAAKIGVQTERVDENSAQKNREEEADAE